MLEIRATEPSVLHVLASPEACAAAVTVAPDARAGSVAAGELLLLGDGPFGAAQDAVRDTDPDGIAVDVSDGWAAWELRGPGSREAFARLSELRAPEDEGFAQGEVARLPVKVFAAGASLTLLVPAMWAAYLGQRIREDCAALDVRETAP